MTAVWLAVLLVTMVTVTQAMNTTDTTGCDSPCVYQEGDKSFRCSDFNCQTFPIDPKDGGADEATLIDLSHNMMEELPEHGLDFPEMVSLDLSHNHIQTMPRVFCSDCRSLKYLNLSSNSLSSLDNSPFFGLHSLQVLSLDHNDLTILLSSDFMSTGSLQILRLGYNSLSSLDQHFSTELYHLEVLELNDNAFDKVERQMFSDFYSLKYLSLSSNHLSAISNDTFVDMRDLEVLDLSGNKLTDFGFESFSEGTRPVHWELQTILLNGNQLSALVSGTFVPFKNLSTIVLDRNPIKVIEAKVFPESLRNFTMKYNMAIETIHNGTFSNLQDLDVVDFTGCQELKDIRIGAFSGWTTSLKRFDVSECGLTSLPEDLLNWPDVTSFDLQGNPWDCDCDLQWMKSALPDDVTKTIMCRTPRAVKGQTVYSLAVNNFTCSFYQEAYYKQHAAGVGLVVAATLVFVVALTALTYSYRQRLCGVVPKAMKRKGSAEKGTYQSLYNAVDDAEGNGDSSVNIMLADERTALKDDPAPTPV